jgi:hypothetical protein
MLDLFVAGAGNSVAVAPAHDVRREGTVQSGLCYLCISKSLRAYVQVEDIGKFLLSTEFLSVRSHSVISDPMR